MDSVRWNTRPADAIRRTQQDTILCYKAKLNSSLQQEQRPAPQQHWNAALPKDPGLTRSGFLFIWGSALPRRERGFILTDKGRKIGLSSC